TSATQVDVSWTDVGNETGYVIWRHTSDVFGSATAIYTNAANDTTYSDTAVSALDVYYYWVTATNAVGSSSASASDSGYAAGTTFRFNGFEGTSSDNWSWVPTAGAGVIGPRTNLFNTGEYSVMLRGSPDGDADPVMVFDNVRLPANCQHISLEVAYAADGVDANDDLFLDVSYDNGSTWGVTTQLVDGFSGLDVDFGETNGYTAEANPLVLDLVDNATNVRVRIRYDEAAGESNVWDRYYIDDLKLVTACDAPTVSWQAVRTVTNEDYTTQFSIPVSISQAADATVRVAIAGTAQAGGTDFTAASTTLVFTAGGSTNANLQITNVDDSDAEGPEMVRFTLTQAEGCRVAGPDVHTLFIRDDDSFSLATANLTSGTNKIDNATTWDESGQRLLGALLPDIVAMQEWVITNASYRAFVDANFGTEYDYYVEPESDSQAMPNGVISRWPIVASNEWTDNYVGSRDYVHVKIDLPGTKDLNLISVHFNAGDLVSDITARANEAAELTNHIALANFGSSNYLAIAGDLNQSNRTDETVLTTLGNVVTDATQPEDKAGSKNTNPSDQRPYDFVLPDTALEAQHTALNYAGTGFASGLIFDTREWGDHQYPALGGDSEADNLTHLPVVKVFSLGEVVEPPASFSATMVDETQIDLAFETNAMGQNVVIV
ncbi:MAG TPA: Calx-beta domain-containing protein, partial [Actinomycetota bacterium]|nr:Calx-beta domain-containing protein [Actinomycetota bacterium]